LTNANLDGGSMVASITAITATTGD
jgi:hypothetical protein